MAPVSSSKCIGFALVLFHEKKYDVFNFSLGFKNYIRDVGSTAEFADFSDFAVFLDLLDLLDLLVLLDLLDPLDPWMGWKSLCGVIL